MADPRLIAFINNGIRPLAENIIRVKAQMELNVLAQYAILMKEGLIPANDEPIDDGRQADGVHQLTGNELVGIVDSCMKLIETTTDEGIQRLLKANVRPFNLS